MLLDCPITATILATAKLFSIMPSRLEPLLVLLLKVTFLAFCCEYFSGTYQNLIDDGQLSVSLAFPADSNLQLLPAIKTELIVTGTLLLNGTCEPLQLPDCNSSGAVHEKFPWTKEREEVCLSLFYCIFISNPDKLDVQMA
jgi:hypothetical protein